MNHPKAAPVVLLVAASLLSLASARGTDAPARAPEPQSALGEEAIVRTIRLRLTAFERAWNEGDIRAVISQYDPSFSVIWESDYMGYAQYTSAVKQMMSGSEQTRLRLDINTVRPLGHDYALVNGHDYTIFKDGREQKEIFTVIYMRSGGQWKFIYAHLMNEHPPAEIR